MAGTGLAAGRRRKMPIEIRKIAFSPAELTEALDHFAKATHHAMPPGKITACEVDSKSALSVMVTVQHMAEGSTHAVPFDNSSVAAALIRYCIERKIPVPKAATKSVEAEGPSVALILTLGAKTRPL